MASTTPTFSKRHIQYYELETQGRWHHRASTVTATFLVLMSAIVISSAALCLTLSGIDPITQVIFPGILPGCGGLLISIPFIFYSRHRTLRINELRRREWLPAIDAFLQKNVDDLQEKEGGSAFVEHQLLLRGKKDKGLATEDKNYKKQLLKDLIDQFYPDKKKTEDEGQKAIFTAINTAKDRVGETDKAREKREKIEAKAEAEKKGGKMEKEEDAVTKT